MIPMDMGPVIGVLIVTSLVVPAIIVGCVIYLECQQRTREDNRVSLPAGLFRCVY